MAGFIEQFYYGSGEPQSCCTGQHSRVQKQMRILSDREEELTETLIPQQKRVTKWTKRKPGGFIRA